MFSLLGLLIFHVSSNYYLTAKDSNLSKPSLLSFGYSLPIHLFNKYLMIILYVPGTFLSAGDKSIKHINMAHYPHGKQTLIKHIIKYLSSNYKKCYKLKECGTVLDNNKGV